MLCQVHVSWREQVVPMGSKHENSAVTVIVSYRLLLVFFLALQIHFEFYHFLCLSCRKSYCNNEYFRKSHRFSSRNHDKFILDIKPLKRNNEVTRVQFLLVSYQSFRLVPSSVELHMYESLSFNRY